MRHPKQTPHLFPRSRAFAATTFLLAGCGALAMAHDGPKPPEDELQLPLLLAGGEAGVAGVAGVAESPQTIATRWAAACMAAIDAWQHGKATTVQADLLNWLLANGILRNDIHELGDSLPLLVNEYRQIEEGIPKFVEWFKTYYQLG